MPLPLSMPDMKTVQPCAKISGTLVVPGDKSISHRVGLLASISSGISRVHGFLDSADCVGLLKAMDALGSRHYSRNDVLYIHGNGGHLLAPVGPLDLGNSGTAMRLLAGLLAGFDVPVTLTGDASLCSRPMRRIAEPLRRMGADIQLTGDRGCAPLTICGGHVQGIEYEMPVASAQVKSAVMLAALFAEGSTTVIEPAPTRDHTENIFKQLQLPVTVDGCRIIVDGLGASGSHLKAMEWQIPGDISSAAFWMVAAAAHRRGSVTLKDVGLNPRRSAVIDVLRRMGARIKVTPKKSLAAGEPVGEVRVSGSRLKGTVIGGEEIPALIDEIPVLAVAGALAEGETVIKDAQELRVKESDRIRVMCENLAQQGVDVEEMEDGMRIQGPAVLQPGTAADSFGDHRVAMAMAVLGLCGGHPLTIQRVECIETSYPGFWEDVVTLGGRVE